MVAENRIAQSRGGIVAPEGVDLGPQCFHCGSRNPSRMYRMKRTAFGEKWYCMACGKRFAYQTPAQRELWERLKEGKKRPGLIRTPGESESA